MNNPPDPLATQHFLTPRYWPTWVGLGLLRLICLLPWRVQLQLGRVLGSVMYYLMRRRRHIASVNIGLCFPELDQQQQRQLVKRAFQSVSISVFETALSWWGSAQQLKHLCNISGLEHLQTALARGKGVILLSAHFTCLEIGGRLLALHHPFAVMYKKHRNELFEAVMKQGRESQFERAIKQEDIRGMISALKQNLAVWYAPDQDLGIDRSVFAPFMGVPAATLIAPARLARMSGAAVVPFFPLRNSDDSGYTLSLLPALQDYPGSDEVENATRVNRLLEEQIRKAPEQYLWLHRKFKTRPENAAPVY